MPQIKLQDLSASLVVFVVAVPLSLGIAFASGAPMGAGIVAALVGGILVGKFTGAPLVITGPAAGLTALCFDYVNQFGYIGLCIATIFAGLFQVGFSSLRLGRFFEMVPKSIVTGMLMAIGATILLGQLHILLGSTSVPKSPISALQGLPSVIANFSQSEKILATAGAIGIFALVFQYSWSKVKSLSKFLPGALPAVVIATLISLTIDLPRVEISNLNESIGSAVTSLFSFNNYSLLPSLLLAGFGLAAVAAAETLLTIRASSQLTPSEPKCDMNRELLVQGLGNSVSGVLGGLPMTGVMVRTAANINAGAKTRWAGILHAVWIIVFLMFFPEVVRQIPLAALASVLVLTGIKLLDLGGLAQMIKNERKEAIGTVLCMASILATNLLTGLVVSVAAYICLLGVKYLMDNRSKVEEIPETVLNKSMETSE